MRVLTAYDRTVSSDGVVVSVLVLCMLNTQRAGVIGSNTDFALLASAGLARNGRYLAIVFAHDERIGRCRLQAHGQC